MKYHMTYKVNLHPEGLAKEEIPEGWGAADALLISSIIYPSDGSLSVSTYSWDGRPDQPNKLSSDEKFKIWMMMANALSKDPNLAEAKRTLAGMPFEVFRELLLSTDAKEAEKDGD